MKKTNILSYLKPYWYFVLLAPLCMVLEVMMELQQPALMATIVDEGVLLGNMPLVLRTGVRMLLFTLLGGIGGLGATAFGSNAALRFGHDLRRATFARAMHLSNQQTDRFTTGSLVTRLTNDITMLQQMINFSLRMVVRTCMQFFGGIIMLLTLNVNFAMVLLATMPIQVLAILYIMKKVVPLFSQLQKRLDKVNAVVQEDVTGARVVKAYTREPYELGRFRAANDDLVGTMLRVQKNMAILTPVLMLVSYGATIAILLLGGRQVDVGAMQVGDVMAATSYITQILMSMMFMGFMLQNISRAQASMARVREVLQQDPALPSGSETPARGAGSVRLEGVSFHYPGQADRPVLDGIDLDIAPGEWVAILGATGSGKTSLVNLVPRFYDPTAGRVLVDGVDVKDYDLKALRDRIGFVLQKSELFSGTVEENIRWGKADATADEVMHAARIAQADEFISGFQDGYQSYVAEKGASLSGGQKQRMSIARALLRRPEILIFDDSTSALDLTTEARLQQALRSELADMTVIQIAQRVASVMQADRIAVLEDGRLVDVAPHAVLMQRCDIYRDIYDSQLGKGGAQ